jgi:hypothetical protein
MRPRKLTVIELMVAVAISAMLCSVPSQCVRIRGADDCRLAVESHVRLSKELKIMAQHPAPWMDEFREGFRSDASWNDNQARRLARCRVYDQNRETLIARSHKSADDEIKFWRHFGAAAARHGYKRPRLTIAYPDGMSIAQCLIRCWPTLFSIVVLFALLRFRILQGRKRSRERIKESAAKDFATIDGDTGSSLA